MSDDSEKYLKALVYLQVQAQTGSSAFGRPEQLLQKAGFAVKEIADMLGKSPNAVSKVLARARGTSGGNDD
jgi:hypothetical protein